MRGIKEKIYLNECEFNKGLFCFCIDKFFALFTSKLNRIFFFVVLLSNYSCDTQQKALTGSWGDQGNGTYRNPILNADFPDSDVERVGDTYYMISSKQHMSPGMVILESKDLVNWEVIGHVWDSLSWAPEYNWDQMKGYAYGVWAGDLAYHDSTWFCYQIDYKHGLYVSTAQNIRGPWSAPHQMLTENVVADDPAVFWDDETNEAFLVCNTDNYHKAPDSKDPGNEIRIYRMSWDGQEIIDSGQLVYSGLGTEAAKVYKINNTWYIFLAEWFSSDTDDQGKFRNEKNDRKQIVLRSNTKSIYGPYEKKVVLERGNGIDRSCSQGALIQATDSSWWYTHQLIQNSKSPFQGRPQCLEPVTWVDGWPIVGIDIDGDGIGEPVVEFKKPILGLEINAPQTDDDFSSDKLGFQWEWNHNPRNSFWSLTERPGWLRLKAGMPLTLDPKHSFRKAYNTISQRIMGTTTGMATAKFDISNLVPGQKAGFARFSGFFHLMGIMVDDSGNRKLFFRDLNGEDIIGPVIDSNHIFIRTSNTGDQAFFEFSMDGKVYEQFGPIFTIKYGLTTGDRLGFFCWNEKEEKGYLDVDWFTYSYDGPKKQRQKKIDM